MNINQVFQFNRWNLLKKFVYSRIDNQIRLYLEYFFPDNVHHIAKFVHVLCALLNLLHHWIFNASARSYFIQLYDVFGSACCFSCTKWIFRYFNEMFSNFFWGGGLFNYRFLQHIIIFRINIFIYLQWYSIFWCMFVCLMIYIFFNIFSFK